MLILTDQQASSMMTCADNRYLQTPAIDSLAARGVRFTRGYCTEPVCIPSRFSLVTGRMPDEIGLRGNYPESIDPLPEEILSGGAGWLLRRAGYDTAWGGKTHFPLSSAEDYGFAYLADDERDLLPEKCGDYIRQNQGKPFFLTASFVNPHDICYMAIREFASTDTERQTLSLGDVELEALDRALAIPAAISEEDFFEHYCPPLPANFNPPDNEPGALDSLRRLRPFRHLAHERWSEKEWRLHRWAYCRLTEMVDRQIGVLLRHLEESGKAGETVVIFTSDHGDNDGTHRMEHKTAFLDGAVHIPLILADPTEAKERVGKEGEGAVSNRLVSNGLDLLPTLCDYAGIKPPPRLAGRSFRAPFTGEQDRAVHRFLPVQSELGTMIVTRRYKHILYNMGKNREQLFDLEKDQFEVENKLLDPDYSEVLGELRSLHENYRSYGPAFPLANTTPAPLSPL